MRDSMRISGLALLGLSASLLLPSQAFAVGGGGGCVSDGSCSAPTPTCSQMTTYGVDNCGNSCSKSFKNTCNAPSPSCSQMTTSGTRICGQACTKTFNNSCTASTPSCGQTTTGTYVCGGACSRVGSPCNTWAPYGYVVPGDPVYGFPSVTSGGQPLYKDPNTRDMLGLASKGNIIVGDYTSAAFQTRVLPNLTGNVAAGSKSRPHAIDPTDANLGYHNFGFDAQGRPKFNGNYNLQDTTGLLPGLKADGTPRKFYESSLSNAQFQAYLDMPAGNDYKIDGVLFTNHAFAGYIDGDDIVVNGAIISRDDGLVFDGSSLSINHDLRLVGDQASQQIALPYGVTRPKLMEWKECPPAGC